MCHRELSEDHFAEVYEAHLEGEEHYHNTKLYFIVFFYTITTQLRVGHLSLLSSFLLK